MRKIIVFGVRSDYTETAYFKMNNQKGFKYYKSVLFRKYLSFSERHRIRISKLIARFFYTLFLMRFKKKDDLLFIYHGIDNVILLKYGFVSFCKKRQKMSKHVGVFWDVFDFENKVDVALIKKELDDNVIIDYELAKKYNITYYPLFYSKKYEFRKEKNKQVFFCGEDGGRLGTLKKIAEVFKNNNINFSFYCSNSKNDFVDEFGIHYIKKLDHSLYLEELSNSSVLLDLTKPGATCCSLRFCEAVLYDKKLLSDNENIIHLKAYDKKYMKNFKSIEEIDFDFINNNDTVNYLSKTTVEPNAFIDYIYSKFEKTNEKL